jgi:hypothetical protein
MQSSLVDTYGQNTLTARISLPLGSTSGSGIDLADTVRYIIYRVSQNSNIGFPFIGAIDITNDGDGDIVPGSAGLD